MSDIKILSGRIGKDTRLGNVHVIHRNIEMLMII